MQSTAVRNKRQIVQAANVIRFNRENFVIEVLSFSQTTRWRGR